MCSLFVKSFSYYALDFYELPYFFDQTPRLLFISLLVLCGYYSRAAFIFLESLETSMTAG